MHLLMVAARYLPFVGGIETHIHEIGPRIVGLGHQVTVLTTDPSGTLPRLETASGMTIRRVPARPRNRDYYIAPAIYGEITDGPWDLVHFQGYHTFVPPIGLCAAIRRGIPFVLTFHSGGHSSPLRDRVRGVQSRLLAPLVARAGRLIGVSDYEAEFFSGRTGIARDRFTVVPNGAGLPRPSNPGAGKDENLIISIGRLERYKGHHRVIRAMPLLLRCRPAAMLKIIGSGPYEAALRKLVRRLKLEQHVSIEAIPSAERQRLSDLLASAGLVVLLSQYEAHPVAVMEALSLRRPVLVTDTSGLGELARKGLCRAIPLNANARMVAAAMEEELAAPRQAPDIALPDWDACARQLVEIYTAVLRDAGHKQSDMTTLAGHGTVGRAVG